MVHPQSKRFTFYSFQHTHDKFTKPTSAYKYTNIIINEIAAATRAASVTAYQRRDRCACEAACGE
jgi:hypothetical protein